MLEGELGGKWHWEWMRGLKESSMYVPRKDYRVEEKEMRWMKGCNRKGKQQCYNKKKKRFFKRGKKRSANKLSLLTDHLFLERGIRRIVVDLRKPIYSVFIKTMQICPKCPVSRENCTSISFLLCEEFREEDQSSSSEKLQAYWSRVSLWYLVKYIVISFLDHHCQKCVKIDGCLMVFTGGEALLTWP